jgi:hypothetical protein
LVPIRKTQNRIRRENPAGVCVVFAPAFLRSSLRVVAAEEFDRERKHLP